MTERGTDTPAQPADDGDDPAGDRSAGGRVDDDRLTGDRPAGERTAEEAAPDGAAGGRPGFAGRKMPTTLEEAFGGKQGVLDMGLPGMVFVAAYLVSGQQMPIAIWSAVGIAAALTVIRLVRRGTVQHAIAGFAGVAVAAYVAHKTGEPADYYLPSLLLTVGYAVAFAVSLLVRWPLLGVALGVVFGEGTAWRRDRARRRVYTLVSALWLVMFGLRLAVLVPLWMAGQLVALGIGRLILGYPLYLLVIWISWRLVNQTRPVRPDSAAES